MSNVSKKCPLHKKSKKKKAFICVHNSCCSQIEEVLGDPYVNKYCNDFIIRIISRPAF